MNGAVRGDLWVVLAGALDNLAPSDRRRHEMAELRVTFNEILPIKEAVRGLPRALDRLDREEAEHFVITRRNQPRAVLVGLERYEELLQAEAALRLAT